MRTKAGVKFVARIRVMGMYQMTVRCSQQMPVGLRIAQVGPLVEIFLENAGKDPCGGILADHPVLQYYQKLG
jgi:hypothetical protein